MNATKLSTPLPDSPLDRVKLRDHERLYAEAAMMRGEYVANLVIEALNSVKTLLRGLKAKPAVSGRHHLGPTA